MKSVSPAPDPAKLGLRGFTLLELLVVVAIVLLLASLLVSVLASTREAAWRSVATSNLRETGTALMSYTTDHGGRLPGPLWPGQIPIIDNERPGRLAAYLAPYLGIEDPETGETVEILLPPAYRNWWQKTDIQEPRSYVLNHALLGHDETIIQPWGNLAASDDGPSQPRTIAEIPITAWALSDADQLHPRVESAPWKQSTPDHILHGERRLALFFGGNVQSITESELE